MRLVVSLLVMGKDHNHEIIGLEVTLLSWSDNSFTADRRRSARIPFASTMATAQDISPNQTSQQHYNVISAHQHFLLKHILQRLTVHREKHITHLPQRLKVPNIAHKHSAEFKPLTSLARSGYLYRKAMKRKKTQKTPARRNNVRRLARP